MVVPLGDVDRGDNSVPQECTNDGGEEVETEACGYWDLLDKLAGKGKKAGDVWVRWNEILMK